jgi:hypothetical protein
MPTMAARENRQWFVLYVVVCLEVGLFLTLVPWSGIWERNYFLEVYPVLRPVLLASVVRGAVAGLGVANIYVGLNEILSRSRARPTPRAELPGASGPEVVTLDAGAGDGVAAEEREALAAGLRPSGFGQARRSSAKAAGDDRR